MAEQVPVTLITEDNCKIDIPHGIALMSETLRDCLASIANPRDPIPIPFPSKDVEIVLDYCAYHYAYPAYLQQKEKAFTERDAHDANFDLTRDEACDDEFSRTYARRLCGNGDVAATDLINTLWIAKFLQITPLERLLRNTLARAISGKSASGMRTILGLPDDMTEEEKKETVLENLRSVRREPLETGAL